MQVFEVGLGKMQDGAAAEPLPGEIEDGVGAESCRHRSGLGLAAGDFDGCNEVAGADLKLEIKVVAVGKIGVKDSLAAAQAFVERIDLALRGQRRLGEARNVGCFFAVAVEAQIGQGGRGLGKDSLLERQTGLARMTGKVFDLTLGLEIASLGRGPQQEE